MPPGHKPELWLVEDSAEDQDIFFYAAEAVGLNARVRAFPDAHELRRALSAEGPAPALLLLDLNLPSGDGRELLRELRAHPFLKRCPILILSSSEHRQDLADAYDGGAAAYIVKPLGLARYEALLKSVNDFWFRTVRRPA